MMGRNIKMAAVAFTAIITLTGCGTKLYDMGLKNKRVAIVGRNRYEWVVAHLSNLLGGIVSIPLDKELQVDELESCLERSKADVIVFDEKYIDNIEKIKQNGKTNLQEYVCMTEQEGYKNFWTLKKEGAEILKNGNNEYVNCEIDNDKMAILLFTSGTTSKSKAVALSHRNIASNIEAMNKVEGIRSTDVNMAFLPLHHTFECTVGFLFSLYVGAETVFCDGIRHIPENLAEYKVSVMASVPAIYERLFKIIKKHLEKQGKVEQILKDEEKYKDSSMEKKKEVFKEIHDLLGGNIKLFISGAASLDPSIEEKFRRLGFNMVQGYGLTETAPIAALTPEYEASRYASTGKAVKERRSAGETANIRPHSHERRGSGKQHGRISDTVTSSSHSGHIERQTVFPLRADGSFPAPRQPRQRRRSPHLWRLLQPERRRQPPGT